MCGAKSDSLTKAKVEKAELNVCDECVEMGTPVNQSSTGSDTETKYSTGETEHSSDDNSSESSSKSSQSYDNSSSMDVQELRADFGDAIRDAREGSDLSLSELADELNEKESHIRQVEQENRQPTKELQQKFEDFLGIELSIEGSFDEFESDSSSSGQTLGDMTEFNV
jgi:putative transcription factor